MAAKRSLPAWMSACGSGSCRPRSEPTRERRGKRRRAERSMLYWLNERELMETALSVLKRNEKTDVACPVADPEVSVVPETDTEEEPDSDAQERTCASSTDVCVAEQQTVPYISCIEKEGSRRSDSAGDHQATHSMARDKEPELEDSQVTKTDHDGLQLVREIFFS